MAGGLCHRHGPEQPPAAIISGGASDSSWGKFHGDLLDLIGQTDPLLTPEPPSIYAVACRWRRRANQPFLETWTCLLALGEPLPTLPLWLASDLAIPLDLESSYQQACRALRIS